MLKKTALIGLFLISFFFAAKIVLAEKEADDYLYQLEKYRQTYSDFTKSRDAYLQYKSLKSKDDAVLATKNMVLGRNLVLRTYFLLLKTRLRNTSAIVGSEMQSSLVARLDAEINWLEAQSQEVNKISTPSIEDLFVISDRLEAKSASYNLLAYESLSLISIGKVKTLQGESLSITNLMKGNINSQEASGQAQLNNWIAEVENQNYQNQKSIELAEAKYNTLTKKSKGDLGKLYFDLKADLETAVNGIKNALNFQKQVFSAFSK